MNDQKIVTEVTAGHAQSGARHVVREPQLHAEQPLRQPGWLYEVEGHRAAVDCKESEDIPERVGTGSIKEVPISLCVSSEKSIGLRAYTLDKVTLPGPQQVAHSTAQLSSRECPSNRQSRTCIPICSLRRTYNHL